MQPRSRFQIADALSTAHAQGIIHRDLKPSNLLLSEGRIDQLKVLDFGVARWRNVDRELTLTNQIIGTPGYMAPEQARGMRDIDARADLFALGCVMYRCIAGEPAFTGEDVLSILARLVVYEPPLLGDAADGVPVELEDLVRSLLSKPASRRPESAARVRDELERISALFESGDLRIREREVATAADLSAPTRNLLFATSADPTDPLALGREQLASLRHELTTVGAQLSPLANGALLVEVDDAGDAGVIEERTRKCATILSDALPGSQVRIRSGLEFAATMAIGAEPKVTQSKRAAGLALGGNRNRRPRCSRIFVVPRPHAYSAFGSAFRRNAGANSARVHPSRRRLAPICIDRDCHSVAPHRQGEGERARASAGGWWSQSARPARRCF